MSNENIFFLIDDKDDNENKEIRDDFAEMLNELNEINSTNQIYNLPEKNMEEVMYFEYKINYTVKELLLICEYYGIAKDLKTNKCNKEEIIVVLVSFENNPENNAIVLRRQQMWYYINNLKADKFMKKYVLW
jgi:hypothetical protein